VSVLKHDLEGNEPTAEFANKIETTLIDRLIAAIQVNEKQARDEAIEQIKDDVLAKYEQDEEKHHKAESIIAQMVKDEVRRLITKEKIRTDGRKLDEIRPLSSRVGLLPRAHGSGLFTRGQTQALSVCTLGALGDVQILDGLELE